MRTSTKWALVGLGLLALSAMTAGVILVLVISGGRVPGNAVLIVKVAGELPDYDTRAPLAQALGGEVDTLMETVESIERATHDARVHAIYLKVQGVDAGWGKTQELRAAIAGFRQAGKPVYSYFEFAGNREYFLASVADQVFMAPGGILMPTGLLADASFYKGTLDKLKIRAELEHIGEYKTASDVWTRDSMSEAHREVTNSILDSLFSQIVDSIAASRKVTPSDVRKAIDAGFLTPNEALSFKLVDGLLYTDQVDDKLRERLGEYSELRVRAYKKGGGFKLAARNRVAVVNAVGAIVPGKSGTSPYAGEFVGSDSLTEILKDLREDDGIKAVVLRVDSPGGSGTASDVIWRETNLLKGKKPLVVSMADVAGSGGYYIAMAADVIVAEPGTITGSIGVFSGKFNMKGFYDEWLGLHRDQIKRGENADFFTDYQGFSDAQRQRLRGQMQAFYEDFVHKAATGRKKQPEEIEKIARGRIWSGAQAKDLGLVDELGGLSKALSIARERAGIGPDERVSIEVYPRPKTLFQSLTMQDEARTLSAALPASILKALRAFAIQERFAKEGIILWTAGF